MDNSEDEPYQIHVRPAGGEVTARAAGQMLVTSSAANLLYETRRKPDVYFPMNAFARGVLRPSDYRTFCPMKGTASYFDVVLDDQIFVNGAWSYSCALAEAAEIEGMIGLMPNVGAQFEFDILPSDQTGYRNLTGPLVDWLVERASRCQTPGELVTQLANAMCRQGIAVSRLVVLTQSLHPQIIGNSYTWARDQHEVAESSPSHDILDDPRYLNSPLRHVINGLGGVRQMLLRNDTEFSFPILDDLKAQGATDYVAMPLPFSTGQINVMTLATDQPDGFTTADLGLIFECSALIGRLFEVFALRLTAQSLLETYLGKRTGARVLGGEIKRGDGENIDAAVLFCDLRGSTQLAERLERGAYLDLLNGFFDLADQQVKAQGGEVLKYIGDAVLAIFPVAGDHNRACEQALDAATEIAREVSCIDVPMGLGPLACASGIAFGNVTYGNVGSVERLDFTVIGRSANIAARLCDYAKRIDRQVVFSGEIDEHSDRETQFLGPVNLHNVSTPEPAYALRYDSPACLERSA